MTSVTLKDIQEAPQTTKDSQLTIDMSESQLAVGEHRFELSVTDSSNNVSRIPAQITVFIIDTEAPTPLIELRDAEGRLVEGNRIPFGASFILNGARSTDTGGGTIAGYEWRLIRG